MRFQELLSSKRLMLRFNLIILTKRFRFIFLDIELSALVLAFEYRQYSHNESKLYESSRS